MTLMDYPIDARFRAIEDRLSSLERDMAIVKTLLEEMGKRMPSPWLIIGLILPLYGLLILGFSEHASARVRSWSARHTDGDGPPMHPNPSEATRGFSTFC